MFGLQPEFILSRVNMTGINTRSKYQYSVDHRSILAKIH